MALKRDPITHSLGVTTEGKAGCVSLHAALPAPPPPLPPTDCFHMPGAGRPDAQALGPGSGAEQVVFWTEAHDHARAVLVTSGLPTENRLWWWALLGKWRETGTTGEEVEPTS